MPDHIQIGDTAPRIQYVADGAVTVFAYPFPIFKIADLEIFFGDVEQTVGFTVSGAGTSAGGSVTFAVAPVAATLVTLRRRLAIQRTTDFQADGVIRSKTLNDELDYQTAALQQLADDLQRCVQRPVTSPSTADLSLPEPSAGRALKWASDGLALVNSDTDPDLVVATAQAAASAAQTARTGAETAQANAEAAAADAANDVATLLATEVSAAQTARSGAETARAGAEQAEANAETAESNAAISAAAANAAAAAVNLPSAAGHGTHFIRQKVTEDGFEYRTPAQVLTDIGGQSAADVTTALAVVNAQIKRTEDNLFLTVLRMIANAGSTYLKMTDGWADELEDETGIDTGGSSGQTYDSTNDCYANVGTVPATCKLLIHSEAANGNTTFTDSATAKTVTGFGSIAHSTAQAKFVASSILFNGTTQYIQLADSADWTIGSNDFTLEMWIRPTAATGGCLMSQFEAGTGTPSNVGFYWNQNADGTLSFGANNIGSGSLAVTLTTTNAITFGAWNHVAVSRVSGTVKVFINGVSGASASGWTGWTDSGLPLKIGASLHISTGVTSFYSGNMEEVAWYNGLGKYSSNFSVPTAPIGTPPDMVLRSAAYAADAVPTEGRVVAVVEKVDALTHGTDNALKLSRNGGTTFTAGTITVEATGITFDGHTCDIISAVVNLTGQTSGSSVKAEFDTLNNKSQKIHGWYVDLKN